MAVSESQLATWSNRGAETTAQTTYASIKNALKNSKILESYKFEVYLQGSYGNATNIYGNSDVDVVVELNSSYYPDLTLLSTYEKALYERQSGPSSVSFEKFRADVFDALKSYYGSTLVQSRNKCIAVSAASGRLKADVIPCLENRLYTSFNTRGQGTYIPGIRFYTLREVRQVINYPKPHRDNGSAKNQRVNDNYKPLVRLFKNWRNRLVIDERLGNDVAPSYFVECLAYNIPDNNFSRKSTWESIVRPSVENLTGNLSTSYVCQNGVTPLFGATPEQWTLQSARKFVNAIIEDWNRGR